MGEGRPTSYKPEYDEQARKLCLLGAIDTDLADFFNVVEKTIYNWKDDQPSFLQAIKDGKQLANANVADRLYKRATGYSHAEDKIFNNQGEEMIVPTTKHYAPDTTACIFWLKNRAPEQWRDKQEIESSGNVTVEITRFADKPTE